MPTFETRIAATANDGTASDGFGGLLTTTAVIMGVDASGGRNAILRFLVTIPNDAIITNAYITLITRTAGSDGTPPLRIHAEHASNPTFPSSYADYAARTRTTAFVDWNITVKPDPEDVLQTPDLTSIVQEVLNLDHPSQNAIQFFIGDNGGSGIDTVLPYDYSDDPDKAALLHIEYETRQSPPYQLPQPITNQVDPLEFFLCVLKPVTVFTGRVNGTPSAPYVSLTWDGGATGTATSLGTSGAPLPANTLWVGTSAGGRERGVVRVRSWTPSEPTGTTGTLEIAETDDVGPQITDDDFLTIKLDWRLWPRAPRIVQSGADVTFFEDYDVAYTDQTNQWYPVAAPGPPAVVFLESGSVTVNFVGDRSTAIAPGATLSSFLWTAHGSSELTSSSQGTEGTPVTFTYTAAGQYLVSLQVTDSNGKTHTSYTWVFVIDLADKDAIAYTNFDAISDSFDFASGGGESRFTVNGAGSIDQFPREALVVHAYRGSATTETGTWPFRGNVLFAGHIIGDSVTQDPEHSSVNFRATSVTGLMKNLKTFPVSLTDKVAPARWVEGSNLTVDRVASFVFKWRSTLDMMTSVQFSGYTPLIPRQDFGPTTLYQQLQGELASDAWARVVANHQGVLYLEIDYNNMLLAERAAQTTRKTLHKGIWLNQVDIAERSDYETPVSQIKASGIVYAGGGDQTNVTPLFSEAPGDLPASFGKEAGGSRFILNNQTDLNIRCGFMLAKENQRFTAVRMTFINDGSFTVAPQEIFPAIVEAADNNRGVVFNGTELIPRRIRRSYDHENGLFRVDVEFEISSTGPPGITVSLPAKPPSSSTTPPVPIWEPVDVALVSWKEEGSVNYFGLGGVIWESRNQGLSGSDLRDHFGGIDPWWWTPDKQNTYNPEKVILFKCVTEKLFRSTNGGRLNWSDITPTGTPSGADFMGLDSDVFTNQTHYFLMRYQDVSGTWQSYLLKTVDDGSNYEWGSV